jgi:hypothetical protein
MAVVDDHFPCGRHPSTTGFDRGMAELSDKVSAIQAQWRRAGQCEPAANYKGRAQGFEMKYKIMVGTVLLASALAAADVPPPEVQIAAATLAAPADLR